MTHPQFRLDSLHQRSREFAHEVDRIRLLAAAPAGAKTADEAVSIRLCRVSDDASLERLAALDSREAPRGRHVVAEVDGELVAALPLSGGEPFADPFRPTAHLLPLMRRQAAQLVARPRPHRSRAWHYIVDRPLV